MTTQHLSGKVALIQGGSRGIGAAIVKRLAAGAAVAFTYVSSTAKAEELQNSITANGGKALAIKADSADEGAIRNAVSATVEGLWPPGYSGEQRRRRPSRRWKTSNSKTSTRPWRSTYAACSSRLRKPPST